MMFSSIAVSAVVLSLVASSSATFNIAAKTNVALYYGQGPNEQTLGLKHFCQNNAVDIIPLAFLDVYPAQGNGYPGTNFAGSCTGTVFAGPGYNGVDNPAADDLQKSCPTMVDGISYCQGQGKKILLSLGGAPGKVPYQLTSAADAEYLADFLWGAFGPYQSGGNWPRPFDTSTSHQSVDGFDFDIELIQPGEQALYITLINKLRAHFPTGAKAKKYLITGAPQCIVPDAHMGDIITGVAFDILFMQYYNTDQCSGRNWVTANPNYPAVAEQSSGFSYWFGQLEANLDAGASKNAKIYFGLPASTKAANSVDYLDPAKEITPFVQAYFCNPRFGGVMIWEAIYADQNVIGGKTFQQNVKNILVKDGSKTCPKVTTTSTSATPTPTACCTASYTVQPGDYCYLIATNAGITVSQLEALNPVLGNDPNVCDIFPAQVLCLQKGPCGSTTTTTSTQPTSTLCPSKTYTVAPGDYCYLIATNNGITVAQLESYNPSLGSDPNVCNIQVGQVLVVAEGSCSTTSTTSTTSTSQPTSTLCPSKTYTVAPGDYCYLIATNNGITVAQLESYNPSLGSNPNVCNIQVGQVLVVAEGPCSTTSTTSSTTSSSSSSSSSSTVPSTTGTTSTTSTISSSSSTTGSVSSTAGPVSGTTSSSSSSSSSFNTFTSFSNTTSSATSLAAPTTTPSPTSVITYTTTTTSVHTVTSCPPTVTNCPLGQLTTDTITYTTTYCPGGETTPAAITTAAPIKYTTSVVYTTLTYTITACPAIVTNCPVGHVTTETKVLYTTICPVEAATTPASIAPEGPAKQISVPAIVPGSAPTGTTSSTTTQYVTVVVPKSSSSFAVVVQTVNVVPVPTAVTTASAVVVPSGSVVQQSAAQFTGVASGLRALGMGGLVGLVVAVVFGVM